MMAQPDALYSDTLELDMGDVVPSIAGPKRPQDRIALTAAAKSYAGILESTIADRAEGGSGMANINGQDRKFATAPFSSQPSRAVPIPRTRPSCWLQGWSRRKRRPKA